MADTKTVKVKDLKAGDILASTGLLIKGSPFTGLTTPFGKVQILVEKADGHRELKEWNRNTTVKIKA